MTDDVVEADTYVVEKKDVDVNQGDTIRISPDDSVDWKGPGKVDTVIIRAEEPDYQVTLSTNTTQFIRDTWNGLNTITDDSEHISAYQDSGDNVAVIEDVPYSKFSILEVDFQKSMTVSRVRGVWVLGVPVTN